MINSTSLFLKLSSKKTVFIILVIILALAGLYRYHDFESSLCKMFEIRVSLEKKNPTENTINVQSETDDQIPALQTTEQILASSSASKKIVRPAAANNKVRTTNEQQIEAIEILSLAVESAAAKNRKLLESDKKCDWTDGIWVKDTSIKRGEGALKGYQKCHVDPRQNCKKVNKNAPYLGYRWVLNDANCETKRVRFARELFLSTVRNKRIVFIGDSLTRNMFQSLACLLYVQGDKGKMIEDNMYKYRYPDFGVTIEFIVSNYLVKQTRNRCDSDAKLSGIASSPCLDVKNVDGTWAGRINDFDIFMFATGGLWEHDVQMRQVFGSDKSYRTSRAVMTQALSTVMNYLARPEFKNKELYWRCSEVSHFFGGEWNSGGKCVRDAPSQYAIYNAVSLFIQEAVIDSLFSTSSNITLLDITKMSGYRQDAHPSSQARTPGRTDCKHWCLPGVTDHGNEIWLNMLREAKKKNI